MKQFLLAILPLLLLSCAKDINTKEAVRTAVMKHLSTRGDLNLASMDVNVGSITWRQNEADASVSFRPRGSADEGMQMTYVLERKGDEWVVKDKKSMPTNPHGGDAAPVAPSGPLPPGHPPVADGAKP
jgi:hypothetical protein